MLTSIFWTRMRSVIWAHHAGVDISGKVGFDDMALIAKAPEMAELLAELEWAHHKCGICDADEQFSDGHAPDCRLNALLSELRGVKP